jgi:diketogulonate reductase-like aldo/keto reductase
MYLTVLLSAAGVAAASQPSVTLNNGVEMPLMALGTNDNAGETTEAIAANVNQGLDLGFKSLDTAQDYPVLHPGRSLVGVGMAIQNRSRDSFFLISKVSDIAARPSKEYSSITESLDSSLESLGVEFVDLMLLHFPPITVIGGNRCDAMQEQWRAMEDFYKAGKARAIGVSNYCQSDIECIAQKAEVTPAVNQVQYHVGMGEDPRGLKSYLDGKGIVMQAYSPLATLGGSKELITGDLVAGIGQKYNATGAQISLRFIAEQQVPFNTVSTNPAHLQQDLDVFSFELESEDLDTLKAATSPAAEPNGGVPGLSRCAPLEVTV